MLKMRKWQPVKMNGYQKKETKIRFFQTLAVEYLKVINNEGLTWPVRNSDGVLTSMNTRSGWESISLLTTWGLRGSHHMNIDAHTVVGCATLPYSLYIAKLFLSSSNSDSDLNTATSDRPSIEDSHSQCSSTTTYSNSICFGWNPPFPWLKWYNIYKRLSNS